MDTTPEAVKAAIDTQITALRDKTGRAEVIQAQNATLQFLRVELFGDEMPEPIKLDTLSINTPVIDGADYRLSLSGKTITAQSLKFGIVKLFHELGVVPGGTSGAEKHLAKWLKGQPQGHMRNTLIEILESKE